MTTATPPSGSVDESIAFRQGVSVVTIKDQLTGMLPKFSAGTRSRIVIDGNAPDSDVYFDDSMIGMGPGSIVPSPSAIFPVFLYDHDFDEFTELYDIDDPGIFQLEVSGSYVGDDDATFRVQVADPDDEDVFTISTPVFSPGPTSSGLDDLSVILEDVTEVGSDGEERVIIASGSYDSSQGITVYKVEIASASDGSADTIKWYKNDELVTTAADGDVITVNNGNVLEDGDNRIVIKFTYDGFEDVYYGEEQKHTVGDCWYIVAGTQQIRWAQGTFDDSEGITLTPTADTLINVGTPTGILQTSYQPLADGVYIKLPAQVGYPDGTDPNIEAPIWEFKVTALKPEAAITAMQESAGKIQIYPDHRTEQREFGQPKFHNDFDVMTQWQNQIATIEVINIIDFGQQNPDWATVDPPPGVTPRTIAGNTQLYDSELENIKNYSYDQVSEFDTAEGLDLVTTPDPLDRGWRISKASADGSVGPYFFIYDLHEKYKKDRKNYFWFNHGNTTSRNLKRYDDKDPKPPAAEGLALDISGRELSEIEFSGNDEETVCAIYEIYNIDAMLPISEPNETDHLDKHTWSIDGGITLVNAPSLISPETFPTEFNSSGNVLWKIGDSEDYVIAENAGWDPDIDEDTLIPKMSVDINGNILLDSTTAIPTPVVVDNWMEYHGYEKVSLDEVEWMQREGYTLYEDALHNRWFTMYDHDFRVYFIKFNVTDNASIDDGTNVPFDSASLPEIPLWWSSDAGETYELATDLGYTGYYDGTDVAQPDIAAGPGAVAWTEMEWGTYRGYLLKRKNRSVPAKIFVHINRYDKAKDITEKVIERINRKIPLALLSPTHPFFQGTDVNKKFKASLDDNDDFIAQVKASVPGIVQESENSGDFAEDFQCWRREAGSSGYTARVLDNNNTASYYAGSFVMLFNAKKYAYPAITLEENQDHFILDFDVPTLGQLWSKDAGLTTYTLTQLYTSFPSLDADANGSISKEEAWANGYKPYVGVAANSPHVIWYNVRGIASPPAGPQGLTSTGVPIYSLWSYSMSGDYESSVDSAFQYGNILEVECYPKSADRTMAYLTDRAIKESEHFIVPFITSTPANQNILRVQQRDYGPIDVLSDDLDDICPHEGNSPVITDSLRPGTELVDRDRDYTCDSIVFSVTDSALMSQRFSAEKRIVHNYGTYDINCVAEEKTGKLFDYTEQVWDDPDSDVSPGLGQIRPGGSSDLSNYEPNLRELFDTVPQKTTDGNLIWKLLESSIEELTATSVGWDPTTSMYDSDNRKIWTYTVDGTFHTAKSLGTEDDELEDDTDYIWDALGEIDWMTFEGYLAVPSFTHKIAQAAYLYLPHPKKNFYIWFDVAQLSADPGDDGLLDNKFAKDPDGDEDPLYNGGAIRVAIDSYDNAGIVAQKLVDRINSDKYDVGKKYVQVDVDADGNPVYQAIVAGNVDNYFTAEISEEDSSIVRITCLDYGIINLGVFAENETLSFPVTESEDTLSITLIDDGDTDFYVDVTSTIAGTVFPPDTDTSHPDADTWLNISVAEEAYTPTQPGVTKVVSAFLPYEDMQSLSRGYRQTNDDGIEQCLAGPVAYIQDDIGSLIYPVIMSNVSMKDPDQYDGVLEPLEIRARASRNSPDGYFAAHDIKGLLQSDVAEDSRRRSNPITQFIDNDRTYFEPYEDGIEHMESSPSVAGFARTPVFSGAGKNDMTVAGDYIIAAGSETETYYVRCSSAYPVDDTTTTYDKFQWKKADGEWSDGEELSNTSTVETESILTYNDLGVEATSDYQLLEVPGGTLEVTVKVYAKGDINSAAEYYKIQYHDGTSWVDVANSPDAVFGVCSLSEYNNDKTACLANAGTWTDWSGELNNAFHPEGEDASFKFPLTPHWTYTIALEHADISLIPFFTGEKVKLRIYSSPDVTPGIGLTNSVKLQVLFTRRAGRLDLDHGLYLIFDEAQGHNSGDEWYFEAIAKSHEDSVGCAPLPGYLTWQESRIHPFVETSYKEEVTNDLNDPLARSHYATGSLIFNWSGYTADVDTTGDGSVDSTWEKEYLRSLNGQAFTVEDSSGVQKRFEFDNDGILENEGEELISILRPETYYVRFPDIDNHFQKRQGVTGDLLWTDGATEFTAAVGSAGYTAFTDIIFEELTEQEWAQYYELEPALVDDDEISVSLDSIENYAGHHFVITDAVDTEKDHVLNTITGGRYVVWFNIVDPDALDDTGLPTPIAGSEMPTFESAIDEDTIMYYNDGSSEYQTATTMGYTGLDADGLEWSENDWAIDAGVYSTRIVKTARWTKAGQPAVSDDLGDHIQCARPFYVGNLGTGWNPDPESGKMTEDSSDNTLYTTDKGETIEIWDGSLTESEWVLLGGYEIAELDELAWHDHEGWENYEKLKPQYIEVTANTTDTIKRLISKTLKTIRRFRNPNQSKVFFCEYAKPPAYIDYYDLHPSLVPPAGDTGVWVNAEYDDVLKVRLEDDWFFQYSYDPNSPPVKSALDAGWQRGFHTLKIVSRNLGYHKVDEPTNPLSHEPGHYSISPSAGETRSFTIDQDDSTDIGGHKTFKQLLDSTVDAINNSEIDLSAVIRYDENETKDSVKVDTTNDGVPDTTLCVDVSSTNINDGVILTTTPSGGDPDWKVFAGPGLFDATFVLNPTLEEHTTYIYREHLCGIELFQNSPGRKGNTKVTFHYYDESFKGNIITKDFVNGYNAGPYMNETVSAMNMSTHELRPHDHISSAAGMIYNDMPCGTDSITFGGWKK